MANDWLRLWHDMPNDPKWRVIARVSEQPLSLVIALYTAMLVDASKNKSRGVTTCHAEDFAVTLDCDIAQIDAIKEAMQGRVLDGDRLTGWEGRQPKKEDSGNPETGAKSATERKAEQRAREREQAKIDESHRCHDESRNVTLDKDKDKEVNLKTSREPDGFAEFWAAYPKKVGKGAAEASWRKHRPPLQTVLIAIKHASESDQWRKDSGQFIPNPATWLNQKRWEDGAQTSNGAKEPYTYPLDLNREELPPGWLPPPNGCTRYFPEMGWLL